MRLFGRAQMKLLPLLKGLRGCTSVVWSYSRVSCLHHRASVLKSQGMVAQGQVRYWYIPAVYLASQSVNQNRKKNSKEEVHVFSDQDLYIGKMSHVVAMTLADQKNQKLVLMKGEVDSASSLKSYKLCGNNQNEGESAPKKSRSKRIKMGSKIDSNDFTRYVDQAKKFLEKGFSVHVTISGVDKDTLLNSFKKHFPKQLCHIQQMESETTTHLLLLPQSKDSSSS